MVSIQEALAAQRGLRSYLPVSPLIYAPRLSLELNKEIWLKLEFELPTGSFKIRPAFWGLLSHSAQALKNGVVASSSGNFAQAVAYACRHFNYPCKIVMLDTSSKLKVNRTKEYGAEVVFVSNYNDRERVVKDLAETRGSLVLHPHGSVETRTANAVSGLEIFSQEKNFEAILVPTSGGGLTAGIGSVMKKLSPKTKIYAVQPYNNSSLHLSLKAQKPVFVPSVETLADALVATQPGASFSILQEVLSGEFRAREEEIKSAVKFLFRQENFFVEPGGAIGLTPLLSGEIPEKKVLVILTGRNCDPSVWSKLIR